MVAPNGMHKPHAEDAGRRSEVAARLTRSMGESGMHIRMATAGALALAALTASAPAQAVDFSGKTIEYVIPFSVGGGSDTWARFNAPGGEE